MRMRFTAVLALVALAAACGGNAREGAESARCGGVPGRRQAGEPELHAQGHRRQRRQARRLQGQGAAARLLGDLVRPLQGRDPRLHRALHEVQGRRPRGRRRRPARQVREREAVRREDEDELSGARRRSAAGQDRRCLRSAVRAADVVHHLARRPGLPEAPRPARRDQGQGARRARRSRTSSSSRSRRCCEAARVALARVQALAVAGSAVRRRLVEARPSALRRQGPPPAATSRSRR